MLHRPRPKRARFVRLSGSDSSASTARRERNKTTQNDDASRKAVQMNQNKTLQFLFCSRYNALDFDSTVSCYKIVREYAQMQYIMVLYAAAELRRTR